MSCIAADFSGNRRAGMPNTYMNIVIEEFERLPLDEKEYVPEILIKQEAAYGYRKNS